MPDSLPTGHSWRSRLENLLPKTFGFVVNVLASTVRCRDVINTPITFNSRLGRALIRSTFSSRSSVPPEQNTTIGLGSANVLHATSAFTVITRALGACRSPRRHTFPAASNLSFKRKAHRTLPRGSFHLASAIRAGARPNAVLRCADASLTHTEVRSKRHRHSSEMMNAGK